MNSIDLIDLTTDVRFCFTEIKTLLTKITTIECVEWEKRRGNRLKAPVYYISTK